jgi:hypothetical protein
MNGGNRNISTHNTKCPICTSILTKPERTHAMRKNIQGLSQTEKERNQLYLIVWGILRERGGEILLSNPPTAEEIEGHDVEFAMQDDGSLKLKLPTDVIVTGNSNVIKLAR